MLSSLTRCAAERKIENKLKRGKIVAKGRRLGRGGGLLWVSWGSRGCCFFQLPCATRHLLKKGRQLPDKQPDKQADDTRPDKYAMLCCLLLCASLLPLLLTLLLLSSHFRTHSPHIM